MAPKSDQVRHNPSQNRFELETSAGLAVADYQRSANVITIYHTEVPYALRGNGIGEQLVLGTLGEARRLNLKVVPRCWFVRDVLKRHAEFQDVAG